MCVWCEYLTPTLLANFQCSVQCYLLYTPCCGVDLWNLCVLWNSTFVPLTNTIHFPPPLSPGKSPFCPLLLHVQCFQIPHMTGIVLYLSFYAWLTALSTSSFGFIHGVGTGKTSFFCKAENSPSYIRPCIFFTQSSVDRHLVSVTWLLGITLQRAWECGYDFEIHISFLLGICPLLFV